MPVNILLADDHEVVRQGLRTILTARPEWFICGEAQNGQEAVDFTAKLKPDIVILDITMPVMSGLEALQKITSLNYLGTHVLIFTMHESKSLAKAVRQAGARGCVLKSRAAQDLIRAIDALLEGGTFWGPGMAPEPGEAEPPKGRSLLLRAALISHSKLPLQSVCAPTRSPQLARNNVLFGVSRRRLQLTRPIRSWRTRSADCWSIKLPFSSKRWAALLTITSG